MVKETTVFLTPQARLVRRHQILEFSGNKYGEEIYVKGCALSVEFLFDGPEAGKMTPHNFDNQRHLILKVTQAASG